MSFLEKLRGLADWKKKLILWGVVIILGVILLFFWFKRTQNRLRQAEVSLPAGRQDLPALQSEFPSFPDLETSRRIKRLKKMIHE